MSKELFVSSPTHETKVAVLEDDSLVEVFYQRDTDVGLVGGIYKGRVSRVLPGMQSAFVDIGLERDAFLYVSDFFEDSDEYDRVVAEAETRVSKLTATEAGLARAEPAPEAATAAADSLLLASAVEPASETAGAGALEGSERSSTAVQPASAATGGPAASHMAQSSSPAVSSGAQTQQPSRWQESRGRRRRRGRGFERRPEFREHRPPELASPSGGLELLPGESLAKYAHLTAEGVTGLRADAADAAPLLQDVPGPALPIHEAAEPEERKSDDPTGQFSSAGAVVEVTERLASTATSEARSEDRLEQELLAGNLRLAPLPVEPDTPAHHLVSQTPGEEPSKIGAAVRPGVEAALDSNQGAEAEEFEGGAEVSEASTGVEEARGGRLAEVEAGSEEEVEEEEGAGDSFEPVLADAEGGASPAPAGDTSREAGDRSYTLRDSNQRPRFAPRRGRRGRGRFGRRGGGPGQRPEGLPRRQDYSRGGNEQAVQINEVLKEGQEILVQIAKEPLGTKGARITSHIALPGRYLVYMPTIHHTGVSRKIASEEERLRLRNIILEHRGALTGGIIVRTAAAGRSEEELKADIDFLAKLWHEIRTRSERSKAPALIHRDLTLVERILRDFLSPDFKSVRVDNEMEYQNVLDFVHRFQPSLVGHVKLYTKETPMFEEFGIQAEIDKALKPKVWLKSGGYIVINQTEALVAIDVNTGKYVGKTNRLEDTIVKTNIDAVKEIVRQIRLRDLGGIIVIDFIDMDDRRNRMKVVQALEEALRSDRAPTKILSFNEFGLVALTRKRVKQSLERTLSEQCPYCAGSGWIKSVTTVCYEILEEAKKMAHELEGTLLTLRVNPEVARALKSREGVLALELESLTGRDVVIKGDPTVHQERFEIF
ncbi:MAG TPA: Rne/Rng family ribonuclease [Terriglobia bacterium]